MISACGLTRRYAERTALDAVDLEIGSGQLVGLIGPSGAGKSTLLRMCNGFVRPSAGSIHVAGRDVARLDRRGLRELRARVGMVYQQFHLVRRTTALDNVLCGAVSRTGTVRGSLRWFGAPERRRSLEALDRVGLLDRFDQRADTLSGGQQQRVAIARTLVQDPAVVLADEPVASLDPGASERVLHLLRSLAVDDGRTVVASLHQVDLARRYCHRIVGLEQGRLVIDAPSATVTDDQLAELYRLEAIEAAATLEPDMEELT